MVIFVKRTNKPLGKLFQKKIKKYFFFSELKGLEVQICALPNFPIIILILLNRFHKFAISMKPNTSVEQIARHCHYIKYNNIAIDIGTNIETEMDIQIIMLQSICVFLPDLSK